MTAADLLAVIIAEVRGVGLVVVDDLDGRPAGSPPECSATLTLERVERDVALDAERLLSRPALLKVGAEADAKALLDVDERETEAALAVAREVHGGGRLPGRWQRLPGAWARLLVGVAEIEILEPRRPLDDIWQPFHCGTVVYAMRRLLETDQSEEQPGDDDGLRCPVGCCGPCCDPNGYEFTNDPIPF